MDSAKKFKSALNIALADNGGVIWEDVKDVQLQGLLKRLTRNFFLANGKTMKAATTVGRQTCAGINHFPEEDVYVFNEQVQVKYICLFH
jgi:hypothetical protein